MGDKTKPARIANQMAQAVVRDVRAQGGSEATPQLAKSVAITVGAKAEPGGMK